MAKKTTKKTSPTDYGLKTKQRTIYSLWEQEVMHTEEEELPAVSVQLPEVDAELVDWGAIAVLVQ